MAGEKICEGDGRGLLLPLLPEENSWPHGVRALLYLVVLSWCFLGVSIVADVLMAAIEAITSRRRSRQLLSGRLVHVRVWNPTVANLTLMALGSSAPEILLSIIEVLGKGMFAGELGPSTIVGSAAFNLMVIIAVCVCAVPDGQKRTIRRPGVFAVTAAFSLLAYVWLLIVLAVISPDVVEWWEGLLMFLLFPVLVLAAWLVDVGGSRRSREGEERRLLVLEHLREEGLKDLAEADVEARELEQDAAQREIAAGSIAQHRLTVTMGTGLAGAPKAKAGTVEELRVGFACTAYAFGDGEDVVVHLEAAGRRCLSTDVDVEYCVLDKWNEVIHRGTHSVLAGEEGGGVAIPGPLDRGHFWVELLSAAVARDAHAESPWQSGAQVCFAEGRQRARVTVRDPDAEAAAPGALGFAAADVAHAAAAAERSVARIVVRRAVGALGELRCAYRTEAASARRMYDYDHAEGVLRFPRGALEATVEVGVAPKGRFEHQDKFYVHLEEVDGGSAVLPDAATCVVTIGASSAASTAQQRLVRSLDAALNFDALRQGRVEWGAQLRAALRPVGGSDEDAEGASVGAWALHLLVLPWKLLFALIPPTSYGGGWVCFSVALVFIGLVTALIGDLAALLGCCVDLPDHITAITVVALGTSLPDTFASRVAAKEDPSADNAVGNVTGSNAVNVFLGLGLPWTIASAYWAVKGRTAAWEAHHRPLAASGRLRAAAFDAGGFAVPAGDLAFSVAVFVACAVATLAVVLIRRRRFQAELGGPRGMKIHTAVVLVSLWIFYVSLASWRALRAAPPTVGQQAGAIAAAVFFLLFGMSAISALLHISMRRAAARKAESKGEAARLMAAFAAAIGYAPGAAADLALTGSRNSTIGSSMTGKTVQSCSAPPPNATLLGSSQVSSMEAALASMKGELSDIKAVCGRIEVRDGLAPGSPPEARRSGDAQSDALGRTNPWEHDAKGAGGEAAARWAARRGLARSSAARRAPMAMQDD